MPLTSSMSIPPPPPAASSIPATDNPPQSNWKTIQSLVPLVRLLSSFEEHDNTYSLVGPATSGSWSIFLQATSEVESLALKSEDIKKLDPSTYIRIAQELKGRPLFPALRAISINDLESSISFSPIFISPTLEEVVITTKNIATHPSDTSLSWSVSDKKTEALRVVVRSLLRDIAQSVPSVKVLRLNIPQIPHSWLPQLISSIGTLRVLDLGSLCGIGGFDDVRPLESLHALESLSLKAPSSIYDLLSPDSDLFRSSLTSFLPSLKSLTISGPYKLVLDFVQSVSSQSLVSLQFSCTTAPHTPVQRKKIKKSKLLVKSYDKSIITAVSEQWFHTLEEFSFSFMAGTPCDLKVFSSFKKLKKIAINGEFEGKVETFDSSSISWASIESLSLPASFPVSFSKLSDIASSAPLLQDLNVALDIRENIQHIHSTLQPIHHPLRNLSIAYLERPDSPASDVDWQHVTRVARCINKLFPKLRSINASVDVSEWEKVMLNVILCQDACYDEMVRGAKWNIQ